MSGHLFLEHDGCRLAYRVRGKGPPVLWIQGVGIHGDGWDPQVNELSTSFCSLTFDNRGMGESQPIHGALTLERMAADALALVDGQGWSSVHVVGHSMGGLIAQHLALAFPNRVRSLSLLCTFARGRDAGRSLRMMWIGMRSRIGTKRARRHAFLEMVMPPSALDGVDRDRLAADLEPLFGHDLADQPPIVMKQLKAMAAYDATPRLGALAGIPTLVASAEHDPIAPPKLGRVIAEGIPGSRYVEVGGASHGVTIHDAPRINQLILEHLRLAEAALTTSASPRGTTR